MTKRALIIIDLQKDYFPGGRWTLDGADEAVTKAATVLEDARKAGDLVVHVRHEFTRDDAPFFAPGSPGAEIHPSVAPAAGETVVLKHNVNAFKDTNLKDVLDENGVTEVTIVGAMSHMCIDAGARAASDFGYGVTVVEDACATRDLEFGDKTIASPEVHAAYMSSLGFAYANVVKAGDYLTAREPAA